MSAPAYFIAVLGNSPAVLSETLWWATVIEDHDVLGVEVWTTTSQDSRARTGWASLRRWLRSDAHPWDRLRSAVDGRVPEAAVAISPTSPTILAEEAVLPTGGPGLFRVVCLSRRDGTPVEDIRDPSDAAHLGAALYDRVARLRCELPPEVILLGSLTGGRKTMSSALESAFALQARPGDRLLHALVHPQIETRPHELERFVFPDRGTMERTGVPLSKQVTVYDTPFPLVRNLLRGVGQEHLLDLPHGEALGVLRALAGNTDSLRGDLVQNRRGARATYTVRTATGAVAATVQLRPSESESLAALAEIERGLTRTEWWERMRQLPRWGRTLTPLPAWHPTDGAYGAERKRLHDLRLALLPLAVKGLGDFVVHEANGVLCVPAGHRIRIAGPVGPTEAPQQR